MGCSCLKSNTVIKSKVISIENSISNQIPENIILPQQQHISNNNIIPSNNSNNNQCTNNNQNEIFNLNNNNNISNAIPIISSGNPNFEPYLISKNDPNFNYPEIPNEYLGHGLKRMKGYISAITLEALQKVRDDFWSSRVEGNPEIWELLHAICHDQSLSDEDIIGMLRAGGIIPFKDCINVVYDSKGALYEIPNYCINDPSQYNIPEIEYTKEKPNEEEIEFKIRYFTHQFGIKLSNMKTIAEIKELILKEEKYKDMEISRVRLFFGGKELHEDKEIWFYDIQNDSIVQMLVRQLSNRSNHQDKEGIKTNASNSKDMKLYEDKENEIAEHKEEKESNFNLLESEIISAFNLFTSSVFIAVSKLGSISISVCIFKFI